MPPFKAFVRRDIRLHDMILYTAIDKSVASTVRQEEADRITDTSGLPCYWQGSAPVEYSVFDENKFYAFFKRCMDIAISILALLFLLPMLCFVGLAIKMTSPGPVLFLQPRQGLHGEEFRIFKFRTMYHDKCSGDGVEQTRANDERVTRIGAFLRRTSIDELPQFLNVLRGEMSIVGPRPHVRGQLGGGRPYRDLVPFYDLRLTVKPGITGWAQVNGLRGSTNDPHLAYARVEHDIAYIQNASIGLDLRILALTAMREFIGGSGN